MRGDVIYGGDVMYERQIPEVRNSPPGMCGSFDNSVIYANINDLAEANDLAERRGRNTPPGADLRAGDMQSLVLVQRHLWRKRHLCGEPGLHVMGIDGDANDE